MAYRLAEIGRGLGSEAVTRPGASTYPGRKQVVRGPHRDMICLEDEAELVQLQLEGRILLEPVIEGGRRLHPWGDVESASARRLESLEALPAGVRHLTQPDPWPVTVTDRLAEASLG